MSARQRLVVVANRLPVHRASGSDRWELSPGGLVTAMEPVLRARGGSWVGWSGVGGAAPKPFTRSGISIRPVAMSDIEIRNTYHGMSNATLWPLYHNAIRTPEFSRVWWNEYVRVNRRFAESAAASARDGDVVWVHDFHLQLVPAMLRELRPKARIGFFLHIPFPPQELFAWLPWRRQILEGLLGADVVGFQTPTDAEDFAAAARRFAGATGPARSLRHGSRRVRAGAFPISIDFAAFDALGRDGGVRQRSLHVRERLVTGRQIILCVDRLDYTKGIDLRLRSFERLLRRGAYSAENTVLVQIAVPTRDKVPEYAVQRATVEGLVGAVNGDFSRLGRVPVHYFRRSLTHRELAAYYLAADVMLVTPLVDGMNLVAKEFVATRADGRGVLVLSEFAGASHELKEAILVNPRDEEGTADALERALRMGAEESARRMKRMRSVVRRHDVFGWCDRFIGALD